jgi:flavin reductase (DIM6/NTAB) family NADH-FMN oxidoreductase RutF
MRDGSTKHTLENILEVDEVVINIVNYDLVQQQSLASTEYAEGIDEFEKAGLTPLPSTYIKPPRVAESPIQLECKVQRVIPLSDLPGAGNLVIAEVLAMHVQAHLLDDKNNVKQHELDLVARLGGDWYCRVTQENLFIVPKPLRNLGIGVDNLPETIRLSKVLTGNHLGLLANVEIIPSLDNTIDLDIDYSNAASTHNYAAQLLDQGKLQEAWQVLLRSL